MNRHDTFMTRCIELGLRAKANKSAPVGSVVIQNGNIIAEGFEGEKWIPSGIAHAEIIAVLKAIEYIGSKDLSQCILYTTKEPCFMCSYLIRQTGIQGVVFASRVEEAGGVSSDFPILTTDRVQRWPSPPIIIEGVLKEECENLLK